MIGYVTLGVSDMGRAKQFYTDLLADLGATCDGEPGQRIPDMFYGAYVRDPDGNKLAFFEFG